MQRSGKEMYMQYAHTFALRDKVLRMWLVGAGW